MAISPAPAASAGRERRAGAADVEGAGVHGAELVLQHHRGGRRDVVGRVGAEDDEVDVLGPAAGALQRLPRRGQRDVGGRPVLGRPERLRIPVDASILSTNSGRCAKRSRSSSLVTSSVGQERARWRRSSRTCPCRISSSRERRAEACSRPLIGRRPHVPTTRPPSTDSTVPVTNAAASEARQDEAVGDVLGLAHAAERRAGDHPVEHLLGHRLEDLGGDEPGRHRVDADLVACRARAPRSGSCR